jgi:hypothetical protein
VTFDQTALGALEDSPEEYGELLGRQLFQTGAIARAYQRAQGSGRNVRIRLKLDKVDLETDERHLLRWERLSVPLGGASEPICVTAETPFSRYLPREDQEPSPSEDGVFHLVVAAANPANLPPGLSPVEVEKEFQGIAKAFATMPDRFQFRLTALPGRTALGDETKQKLKEAGFRMVEGAASLVNIGQEAQSAHGIHFIAHGKFHRPSKTGHLFLEAEDGTADAVSDVNLAKLVTATLQLVYLQACESGARHELSAMVGLAAKLVEQRVPAVIGMQQPIEMDDAQVMTRAFYQSLVKDGAVDLAVNAGRRAIWRKHGEGWHIPAVYMSRRDGRVWSADAFAALLARQIAGWESIHEEIQNPLPLRAVRDGGAPPDPGRGKRPEFVEQMKPQAVRLAAEHLLPPKSLAILTGPRGAGKTAILDMLAWNVGRAYLTGDCRVLPIRLVLSDMENRTDFIQFVLEQWRDRYDYRATNAETLLKREILLLIDGEEDLVASQRNAFIRALKKLRETGNVRILLSVDELTEFHWLPEEDAKKAANKEKDRDWAPMVLRTRPMVRAQISRYLIDRNLPKVAEAIQASRVWDLAGESWLLRRMIRYGAGGGRRSDIYKRVADEQFDNLRTSGLTRSCLERALMDMAWTMQSRGATSLAGPALYEILATARGGRDFRLEEIKSTLISPCRFLRPSGEDGVRFAIAGMQAYYAAQYVFTSKSRARELEDIIARLGRYRYLREWQESLVVLAGLMGADFEDTLRQILAESSGIGAGEQVYLAARCFLECRDCFTRGTSQDLSLPDLLVDTLIWRAHPKNDLPIADRRQAIQWLSEMDLGTSAEARRHHDPDRAIRLLVSLGCEEVSRGWDGKRRYEFSSLRLEALNVLLAHPERVARYVLEIREPQLKNPLIELVGALETMRRTGDNKPIRHVLLRGNANQSPLAVFAIGLSGHPESAQLLVEAFEAPHVDREVRWAIAEMLPRLDPRTTLTLARSATEPDALIVYMINRVGRADPGSPERDYLDRCLQSGVPRIIGRALRAFADLGDTRFKDVCERIVRADWKGVRASGILKLEGRPKADDLKSLQHAALEALRNIGDEQSIEVLQRSWLKLNYTLSHLAYSVTDHIYWRMQEKQRAQKNRS